MSFIRTLALTLAACCMALAGCAGTSADVRQSVIEPSLAQAHSDIAFVLSTGQRLVGGCTKTECQNQWDGRGTGVTPFSLQVNRIATTLQQGALTLYPELLERIPGFAIAGFDVYVATGFGPGSASSASGRIALNASIGASQPYDDWLAFVIAREIGHVIARHHEENSSLSMLTSVMMNILIPGSGLLKSAASTIGSGIASGSKRDQQAVEADAIALRVLEASGFRLTEVSLSLVVSPAGTNDDRWSQGFRKSSETLVAVARAGRFPSAESAAAALVGGPEGAAGFAADKTPR